MKKAILFNPEHEEVASECGDDYCWHHRRKKTGEVEQFNEVDITPLKLILLMLVKRVQLHLSQLHTLIFIKAYVHDRLFQHFLISLK